MTEHNLQLNCIAWFRNEYERHKKGVIIPVVNEAVYKNKTFVICKGSSDLIIILKDKVLFAELKVGYNKQSQSQIDFDLLVTQLGYEYKIIRNFEEFKQWLQSQY